MNNNRQKKSNIQTKKKCNETLKIVEITVKLLKIYSYFDIK